MRDIIAHREVAKGIEYTQILKDHLANTAQISAKIGKKIGLESTCFLIALLHDIGKSDPKWQSYIWKEEKKIVNHTSAGGILITELLEEYSKRNNISNIKPMIEILQTVIFSHHGVYDIISTKYKYVNEERKDYNIKDEDRDKVKYNYKAVKNYFEELKQLLNLDMDDILKKSISEFEVVKIKILNMAKEQKGKERESRMYYYHILFRLLLSILKEADIYDSSNSFKKNKNKIYTKNETKELWEKYVEKIEEISSGFENIKNKSELNKVRCEISKDCKESGLKNMAGVYKADLPTGAGKTISTLRFSLHNSKKFEKDRIFYITAYLSVLEQNAREIKTIIGEDEHILEHHSNMIDEEEPKDNFNEDEIKEKRDTQYLLDGWETPIILTTMVQFFNTLFKIKASNIRRFCKLINSVIIMDEVQSIPKKLIYNHNLFTNFLVNIMNINIIHCTATQPYFNANELAYKINYGGINGECESIAKLKENLSVFDRVDVFNLSGKYGTRKINTEELSKNIIKSNKESSVLLILNTKKSVEIIYNKLIEKGKKKVYYLTTNMCAAHRLEKINEMKKRLQNGEKIICVSTQLIEAGVDIDFGVVYRSLTGIDSIIQSMGRCNREGKLEKGKFYIINYEEENIKNISALKDIYIEQCTSGALLTDDIKLDILKLKENYYKKYYLEEEKSLEYLTGKDKPSILELLSFNWESRHNYAAKNSSKFPHNFAQHFKTAAQEINYIDNKTTSIIVYYKKSKELISSLYLACEDYDIKKIKSLLKQLQPYTINEYNITNIKEYLVSETKLEENFGISIHILREGFYDEKIGKNLKKNENWIF